MEAKQKIVIVGAGGRLGAALLRRYREDFDVIGFDHAQLDLGNLEQLRATLSQRDFDVLINSAAQTNVDRCETHQDEAVLLNAEAPHVLAQICKERDAKMIHVSTDYVFDGEKREPYTEEDPAEPISVYGESKREGERRVLVASDQHLVLRVSWVFGPDRPSFIDNILKRARENEEVAAVADKFSTPTYTKDVAEALPAFFSSSSRVGNSPFRKQRRVQLAGIRAMGARLLSLRGRADARDQNRRPEPARYEEFCSETACSFCSFQCKI